MAFRESTTGSICQPSRNMWLQNLTSSLSYQTSWNSSFRLKNTIKLTQVMTNNRLVFLKYLTWRSMTTTWHELKLAISETKAIKACLAFSQLVKTRVIRVMMPTLPKISWSYNSTGVRLWILLTASLSLSSLVSPLSLLKAHRSRIIPQCTTKDAQMANKKE